MPAQCGQGPCPAQTPTLSIFRLHLQSQTPTIFLYRRLSMWTLALKPFLSAFGHRKSLSIAPHGRASNSLVTTPERFHRLFCIENAVRRQSVYPILPPSHSTATRRPPRICRIFATTTAPYNEVHLHADVITFHRALAFLCQTIMEQKVQVLVDNVADSACGVLDLIAASQSGTDNHRGDDSYTGSTDHAQVVLPSPSSAPAGGTGSAGEGEVSRSGTESSSSPAAREAAGRALSKDVGQLRRLVQAAITALRNADAEDQQRGITATASSPHSQEHDRKT